MPRLILLFILFILSLGSTALANEIVLNLDQRVDSELLLSSEHYTDTREALGFDDIQEKRNLNWTAFNRKQFRMGFVGSPVWIRSTIKTIGHMDREVVLLMHQVLDSVQLKVITEGEESQLYHLGKGTPLASHHLKEQSNLNHVILPFKPNQTYQILLKVNSANPVIGGLRLADLSTIELEASKQNQWILTFLLVILLVSFYNLVIFLSTRSKVFLYHTLYVVSLMGYLLNDYGYIALWLNMYDPEMLQKITTFCLAAAYLSMVTFFDSMNQLNTPSILITRLNRLLAAGGYLLIIMNFMLPYEYLIRLLSAQVIIAILVGVFVSYYREKKFGEENRTHKRALRIMLISLAPSVIVYMLNRLGFIDANKYTDFVLFISTFVEVIVISLVLIAGIRENKEAYQRELLIDSTSGLPNNKALAVQFDTTTKPTQQVLVMVWVSGLDKFEVAFGPMVYRQLLHDFAEQVHSRLSDNPLPIPFTESNLGSFPLFHSDKNTFTLLCQPLSKSSGEELQQLLCQSINALSQTQLNSIDLNIMIGAYEFNRELVTFDHAIRKAQLALSYAIKNNQRFKYYNPQIDFDEQKRITLLNDFSKSLRESEFFLLWQPQYDTRRSRISGVEVLARWKHPDYGLVSPDVFIPMLEQSSRICELSHWIIQQVLKEMPALHEKHPGIEVSINLSPKDLLEEGLVEFLDKACRLYVAYIPFITLEITETVMINDYSKVLTTIGRLQTRGFNISIDDFGSGYASFSYLQRLPVNELKIDKIYTDCYREETTYAILESIIELAKRLNMRIVVEGIENQQQIDLFTNLGAERLQGWRLDKPMTLQSLKGKADILPL